MIQLSDKAKNTISKYLNERIEYIEYMIGVTKNHIENLDRADPYYQTLYTELEDLQKDKQTLQLCCKQISE